jgi:N-acetylglucosaminyldiphosphoundecaprenol N-acetyl-beta-D-mannosaminyltransferase
VKIPIGSLNFSVVSLDQTIQHVLDWSLTNQGKAIHFANAYTIALASTDLDYTSAINQSDLTCCDGTPVVWAGKWLNTQTHIQAWQRVYGPDVMEGVLQNSIPEHKHYLLGSTNETLNKLQTHINQKFPNAEIVGSDSPPFREPTAQELTERDQRIKDSGANIVWVGLGTPKQDFEVERLKRSLPVTALAVGAAFDFLAGTVQQAPTWMQKSGTEWVYRWSKEPKRLSKRYLWGNPKFIQVVTIQKLGRSHESPNK